MSIVTIIIFAVCAVALMSCFVVLGKECGEHCGWYGIFAPVISFAATIFLLTQDWFSQPLRFLCICSGVAVPCLAGALGFKGPRWIAWGAFCHIFMLPWLILF
ncbi:MAG: hypothetical protein IKX79_02770, partial [Desulfovibrionaceae bacterium]|nr:hypothetical protein [Desulfovibrionaceae bacterium]